MTADELRKRIIEVTLKNGGHLASSLGAVEIAMALREVFDPEKDRIVWDVGHQAYAWKLLTGRDSDFDSLRQLDGVAPFPNPAESRADAAVAGHAGSAFSVALGLAAARDLKGTDEQVVAVVGDSSMANGHSFEALNNSAAATRKVILILNDNEMSISGPVGSLSKLFGRILANRGYNYLKSAAESIGHRAGLSFLRGIYHKIESRLKGLLVGSRFFEQFGMRYIGPVNGHDLAALKAAFMVARADKQSVVVHVATKKGKGYGPAENDPTKYHGIPAGGPEAALTDAADHRPDWSQVFGSLIAEFARSDERIDVLTAGMKSGTGLVDFAAEFPKRFFDVGIAEGHMVSFAAGLAAGGRRPVVAVYSTFLQRAVDQVIHDVAISKLPVIFCVDRAGVVGRDGVTHQGVFDFALLGGIPNLTICEPCSSAEMKAMLKEALGREGPTVIRYPRGICPDSPGECATGLSAEMANAAAQVQLWTTGSMLPKALAVSKRTGCGVVYARYLKPFDARLLADQLAAGRRIMSLENGCTVNGFGAAIGAERRFGWPAEFVPHGGITELESRYGLSADAIAEAISMANTSPTPNH